MKRIAFFISGTGGNALNLFEACRESRIEALPVMAISSSSKALGPERLRAVGLRVEIVIRSSFNSDEEYSRECFLRCELNAVDIICLCGFLKKLVIPDQWMGRILNIHPGPLPRFGGHGMYGHFVHEAVLAAGVKESGPTIHLVDNQYDNGKILAFEPVPVLAGDTPDTLKKRVYEAEMRLYPVVLQNFISSLSAKGNQQ